MSARSFADLSRHVGHALRCVAYAGADGGRSNVAVECEDCAEILLDFDRVAPDVDAASLQDGPSRPARGRPGAGEDPSTPA